jgi:dUTPase
VKEKRSKMNIIGFECVTKNRYVTKPEFVFPMAMGYNLFSCESVNIKPGRSGIIDTGVKIYTPSSSYVKVKNFI